MIAGMDNEINSLQKLVEEVELLCLENEILRVLLQENWSPAQNIPWQTALSREVESLRAHSPIPALFRNASSQVAGDVPPSCLAMFGSLSLAIAQAREKSCDAVEKAKKAL